MAEPEEVKRLKAERTSILRNITYYSNRYNTAWGGDDDEPDLARAKTFFDSLKSVKDKLLDLNVSFMAAVEVSTATAEQKQTFRVEMEAKFEEYLGKCDTAIAHWESYILNSSSGAGGDQVIDNIQNQLNLPELEMDKFDGTLANWPSFFDAFNANVASSSFDDAKKLAYLMSYLEGEAKDAVTGFARVGGNYQKVVDTLKRHFGNPRLICEWIIKELIYLPAATEENLQSTVFVIEGKLRTLESLSIDLKPLSFIFITLIKEESPLVSVGGLGYKTL